MSESSNSIYGGAATGAAAGSAGGLPGAVFGGLLGAGAGYIGYKANQNANAANAQSVQNQMDFQERMSNTAHTREVADLRNAGINPIATASGGSGSSSPGGASSTFSPSPAGDKSLNHLAGITSITSAIDSNKRANELQDQIKSGLVWDNVNKQGLAQRAGIENTTLEDTQSATIASANQNYSNLLKTGALLDKDLGIKNSTLTQMAEEIQGLSTSNARSRLQLQAEQAEQGYNVKQGEFKSKYRDFLVPTQTAAETIGTAFGGINSALTGAGMVKRLLTPTPTKRGR